MLKTKIKGKRIIRIKKKKGKKIIANINQSSSKLLLPTDIHLYELNIRTCDYQSHMHRSHTTACIEIHWIFNFAYYDPWHWKALLCITIPNNRSDISTSSCSPLCWFTVGCFNTTPYSARSKMSHLTWSCKQCCIQPG